MNKSIRQAFVVAPDDRIRIHTPARGASQSTLAQDVRVGLTAFPKTLPPRHFYDGRGSELFEKICATPEYYPTRVESELLEEVVGEIVDLVDWDFIVELGSGSSTKTETLLQGAVARHGSVHYMPIDVSYSAVQAAAERLTQMFSDLTVEALCADYATGLTHVPNSHTVKLFVFLGGTIGNFEHDEAVELIVNIRAQMEPEDRLLVGADRVKDHGVLHRAYNDAQGITAQFNLNLLRVINRELEATFDLDSFEHHAFYDSELEQIEMHLVSRLTQQVLISELDLDVPFDRRESIRTEISRKFTPQSLEELFEQSDMIIERHFEPENGYFSLVLARPA